MVVADWLALGILVGAGVLGLLLGFGKCLKIFTGGVVGIIISVFVSYFLFGVVGDWTFVKALMEKLHTAMVNANNGFVNFLMTIGVEKIILAVGVFVVVQLIRILLVSVVKGIFEMNNNVMRAINKSLGFLFMVAVAIMISLLIFHVAAWIGGSSADNMRNFLTGAFKLNWVFDNNPLNSIFAKIGG